MTKKEAIDVLIGMAVCIDPHLCCDVDCPFYKEGKDCRYVNTSREFELEEAVKVLKYNKGE